MSRILFSPNQQNQGFQKPIQKEEPKKDFIDRASDVGRAITSFTGGEKIGEFLGSTIASTPLLGKFVTGIDLTPEERAIVQRRAPSTTDVLKSVGGAVLQTGSTAIGGGVGGLAKLGLRGIASQGARIGAKAGATFGAGKGISEEKGIGGIAKEAAITGFFGATVGLVFPVGIAGTAATYRFGSNALRQAHQLIKPESRVMAVNNLTDALRKSFVENSSSIRNALDKIVIRSRSGEKVTKDTLLRELAEDGYMPRVEGRLAIFEEAIEDMVERRQVLAEGLDSIFEKMPDKAISLDRFLQRSKASLQSSPQAASTLNRALNEMDTVFESFRTKFGSTLTPSQVNAIRKEMNQMTKSFKGEKFVQDTSDSIADAARNVIDDILPTGIAKEVNAEIGKLFRMQKTAQVLNNKPIDVGILGGQVGRYIGTVGASGIGLSVGGPGGLVVAGIAAHFGAQRMAQLLRAMRFNDKARQMLLQGLEKDKVLLNKILKESSKEDAQYILRQIQKTPKALPAPRGGTPSSPKVTLPEEGVLKGQEKLRDIQP